MVMLVFTLPSYDVVFKLIRDRFDAPKGSLPTRRDESLPDGFRARRAGGWWRRTSLSICALPAIVLIRPLPAGFVARRREHGPDSIRWGCRDR